MVYLEYKTYHIHVLELREIKSGNMKNVQIVGK